MEYDFQLFVLFVLVESMYFSELQLHPLYIGVAIHPHPHMLSTTTTTNNKQTQLERLVCLMNRNLCRHALPLAMDLFDSSSRKVEWFRGNHPKDDRATRQSGRLNSSRPAMTFNSSRPAMTDLQQASLAHQIAVCNLLTCFSVVVCPPFLVYILHFTFF